MTETLLLTPAPSQMAYFSYMCPDGRVDLAVCFDESTERFDVVGRCGHAECEYRGMERPPAALIHGYED